MELTDYILAIKVAIVAYIYSDVLTEGDMILNGVFHFLDKRLPEWLFKPVIGCYRCVAGQLALWSFLYIKWDQYGSGFNVGLIANHIFFISLTIFIVWITNKIYRLGN